MFKYIKKNYDAGILLEFVRSIPNLNTKDFLYEIDIDKTKNVKNSINTPSGDPFYSPWQIKEEYKNTPLGECLDMLGPIGEARLVTLEPGTCYYKHADIDDRYHLTLTGDNSFMIDIEEDKIFRTSVDNKFYLLDAGKVHTAVNAGPNRRLQLVVRKLLGKNYIKNKILIKITLDGKVDYTRHLFDNHFSKWANKQVKLGNLNNFKTDGRFSVSFELSSHLEQELRLICKIVNVPIVVKI